MESSNNKMPTFGDLTNLSVEKLEELNTVLTTILALPVARDAYAQIIDGKPTRTPYSEVNLRQSKTGKINSISGHSKPPDQAFEEYEKIRKAFTSQDLLIDLKLAQDYQNAPSDSHENQLQLLRIAAASVNALARRTYLNIHPDIDIKPRRQSNQFNGTDEFYVNFYHTSYMAFERYPFGLLDVLGYWAETELFGGLLLFEREDSGSNIVNAFLLPQRTSHAFQLSENQLGCFAGLKVGDSAETVLPFAREADARTELSFVKVGEPPLRIYKNEYDKPFPSNWQARPSCVIKQGDPGAASYERMMETIEEKWLDQTPTFNGDISTFSSTLLTAEEASSSPKDNPSSASKPDQEES